MTALPSVEILPPGSRPTEPGWYTYRTDDGEIKILQIERGDLDGRDLKIYWIYRDRNNLNVSDFSFIARIYPERIGQE